MSELTMLINENPVYALRATFHFPNGDTDTARAADFFNVAQRTVQSWLRTGNFPHWAKTLLYIHYRGYLPLNDEWKDFYIQGNKLCFTGNYGPRTLTARQLKCLDLVLRHTKHDGPFWDSFFKAREQDDRDYARKRNSVKRAHLKSLMAQCTNNSEALALKRQLDKLDSEIRSQT